MEQIVDYSFTSTKVVSGIIFKDQSTVECKHLQLGKVRIDTTLAMGTSCSTLRSFVLQRDLQSL